MATPITSVDENLSPTGNLRARKPGPSKHSEVSLKSVQILKKFWGDEEEDDSATEKNTGPAPDSSQYLTQYAEKGEVQCL